MDELQAEFGYSLWEPLNVAQTATEEVVQLTPLYDEQPVEKLYLQELENHYPVIEHILMEAESSNVRQTSVPTTRVSGTPTFGPAALAPVPIAPVPLQFGQPG